MPCAARTDDDLDAVTRRLSADPGPSGEAVAPHAPEQSDRGYTKAFAVIGQHRWFHTVDDTLDCVDARLLAPVLRAHQRTIEAVVDGAV